MKPFWTVAILIPIALLGYVTTRHAAAGRLDNELRILQERISQQQILRENISNHDFAEADLVSFVEALYSCARQIGLFDHEVTTPQRQDTRPIRHDHQGPAPAATASLKTSRLQVVLHGDYQRIAEYLRTVDTLRGYKQISHLEITVDGSTLRALLLIDFHALQKVDANVR